MEVKTDSEKAKDALINFLKLENETLTRWLKEEIDLSTSRLKMNEGQAIFMWLIGGIIFVYFRELCSVMNRYYEFTFPNEETYIGDSVYARTEHGMLVLETKNGLPTDPSNQIYLEPQVFQTLLLLARVKEKE